MGMRLHILPETSRMAAGVALWSDLLCLLFILPLSWLSLFLKKFPFSLTHRQHWTGCVAHNQLGGAAKQYMLQTNIAVGGDNNQVSIEWRLVKAD
jgi:hypothetical protein